VDRSDVLIVGAGFSRAVSKYMPLTDELGALAIQQADLFSDPRVPRRLFGPALTFESWMSLLAEDQPHLSEGQNLQNRALFVTVTEAIVSGLGSCEASVLYNPIPVWLSDLLKLLHHTRATVVSLNYDTLIEVAVASLDLPGLLGGERTTPRDILNDTPPLPNVGTRFGGPINPTFRLLKLHGSLDWWAAPKDPSGASVNRTELRSAFGHPEPITEEDRRGIPGWEPFIIPPAAAKSSYYQNPFTRNLWKTAFDALRTAEQVSLIGYSLPPTDLVMGGMLESAIRDRNVPIDLVNLDTEDLRKRLTDWGVEMISTTEDPDCIATFTAAYRDRVATDYVCRLAELDVEQNRDTAILVARQSPQIGQTGSRVVQIVPSHGGAVTLIPFGPSVPMHEATAVQWGTDGQPSGQTYPTLGDLITAVRGADRLVIRRGEDEETIIDSRYEFRETGASAKWIEFDSI